MAAMVLVVGSLVAAALLALLVMTRLSPVFRIWPTPGPRTWQSYVFWPLFRSLNVLCFVAAVVDRAPLLGLPLWFRGVAAIVLVAAVALFVYSFRVLGRDNSYGAQDGLVRGGIYEWTRNPQNAMLIVVYGALALAADSPTAVVLCVATMAVYHLMVLVEEPWLAAIYGDAYRVYCSEVPRYFNWKRAIAALSRDGGQDSRSH